MKCLSSWSGGKDSCYALMQYKSKGNTPSVLLNIMNENGKISRSHGLPLLLLEAQAKAIGIPLVTKASSWDSYEENFINTLKSIKSNYGIESAVFGDIDLEPHREWEEKVCHAANLTPILPLWKRDRKELVLEMLDAGIKTIIVSCNLELGIDFLGRVIDRELIEELEEMGIDCCGENGEYHTMVIDCPLFSNPIELPNYEKVQHEHYCFINWTLN